ncbi:MAG: pyridoxamine 5'-phosphate oxidase family protein [Aureispira sp.]
MLTKDVQTYLDKSMLCWLATVDGNHCPNVSPKELFRSVNKDTLVIAHIASPQSVQNIQQNSQVCVSFVDVFVQKGYKLKGQARVVEAPEEAYQEYLALFQEEYGTAFPMAAFIVVKIMAVAPILAPSYTFYPETEEQEQIKNALEAYRIKALLKEVD